MNQFVVMSKDSEGNNYYQIEHCSIGFYVPDCSWSGRWYHADDFQNIGEGTEAIKALIIHPSYNLSDKKGITVLNMLKEIEQLSLSDETIVILSKGRREGSPYDGFDEAYYDKDQGAYGWGRAVIYREEELTEEFLKKEELVKEKMLFSTVLFPVN